MKKLLLFIFFCNISIFSIAQTLQQIESKRVSLPNGWSLTPIGKHLPLGDFPLNLAVSSSKKYIAVTNNGQSVQSIQLRNGCRCSSAQPSLYVVANNHSQGMNTSFI